MKPTFLSFLLLAAPVLASASADVSFDPSAVLAQAKAEVRQDKTEVAAQSMGPSNYDMDCANVTFNAGTGPVSEPVFLRSQEWVTECAPVGGDPRHGGGGQTCWQRPGMSWTQQARITVSNPKPLLPWEHDSFRVCLMGPWLSADALDTAYKYTVTSQGQDSGSIVVVAGAKTPEAADPAGVTGDLNASLALNLSDKWASYYAGERITVRVELKKVVKFWPDAQVFEKDVDLPVASSYPLDLAKLAAQAGQKLEAGKQYYAKYSIKRVGTVSKADFTKTLETGKVSYAAALLALAQ